MGIWKAGQLEYDELKLAVDDAVIDLESILASLSVDLPDILTVTWQIRQVINRLKDD